MPIQFQCDNCGKSLKADESKAGKQVKCPQCENVIRIPDAEDDFDSADLSADQDDANPFKSPASSDDGGGRRSRKGSLPLAGPGVRFVGALLDGLAYLLLCVPGIVLIIVGGGVNDDPSAEVSVLTIAGFGLFGLGAITLLGLQIYLYATRSQSIGKYFMGTQVLDYETKRPAAFVKCFVVRSFVNQLIASIPCVGPIYGIVDVLMVFGEENRCLHDKLAGTYVVKLP